MKDRVTIENGRIGLADATLEGHDFSGLKLKQFTAVRSRLIHCHFDRTSFAQACFGGGLHRSDYEECSFDRSQITAVAPGNARFERCTFKDFVIKEFFGLKTEFVDCVFSGTIRKAVFRGSIPEPDQESTGRTENAFSGNDFRDAKLEDVGFRGGIDLEKQRLPQGPHYVYLLDAARSVEEARLKIIGWQDLEVRRGALAILKGFENDVAGGQKQVFFNVDSMPRQLRKSAELLFAYSTNQRREMLGNRRFPHVAPLISGLPSERQLRRRRRARDLAPGAGNGRGLVGALH